jgi:hypothetical protein
MRLDFSILWFENQPQDVKTQIEEIEDFIGEVGFTPKLQIEPNGSNLGDLIRQQQAFDDFDLVVVDYDLGSPGMDGDHVAQSVRRGFGFTDIIFYSGHQTANLRGLVHDRQIDGVYCVERRGLAERLTVHIEQVVRRLSRLEGMRGLVMGTVGKCDDELRKLLAAEHEAAEDASRKKIVEDLDAMVSSSAKAQAERYAQCSTFSDRLENRTVTSFHLQKMALAVTKGDETCRDHRKVLGRYDSEVLQPRNILGHAIEERGDRGWVVSSREKPAIGSDDFPKLRQDLSLHLRNIESIGSLLAGKRGK